MAQLLNLYFLVALLVLALSFNLRSSTSSHNHHGLKSFHFTLYQQETINKTVYVIVKGVTGPELSPSASPFGSLFVNQDPMTLTSDSSSKVVGVAEGVSLTSSFDGFNNIVVEKFTVDYKKMKGSVSIVGTAHNIKISDLPVVGGTGDFMFVQGYVSSSFVTSKGATVVYQIDFHLFWPPYANPSSLSDQN